MPVGEHPPSRIRQAKSALGKLLAAEVGFVGVGLTAGTQGGYEIVVMVMEANSPVLAKVPAEWEGIPVRAQVGGIPKKQ
jgi:hypothetical protein